MLTEYLEDLLVQRFVKGSDHSDDISIQRHLVIRTSQTLQEPAKVAEKLRCCYAVENRGKPKSVDVEL